MKKNKYLVDPNINENKIIKKNENNLFNEMAEYVLDKLDYNSSEVYLRLTSYNFPDLYLNNKELNNFPFSCLVKPLGDMVF